MRARLTHGRASKKFPAAKARPRSTRSSCSRGGPFRARSQPPARKSRRLGEKPVVSLRPGGAYTPVGCRWSIFSMRSRRIHWPKRCNAQLGEKAAAENNWQRALEAAAGDPGKLITLGDYAEKNGIVDVAQSAFDNAAIQSPKLRLAQQGRLRLAQRSSDTGKIHAVLADMLKIWPNDDAVQNDEGYTRLLLMSEQQAEVE